ncbi:MAG: glycosyltransferase family 2 protein [Opitutaceae bacterium]|nr:glycosyltransferase family 2 protein [Opitutaceae bacterium]
MRHRPDKPLISIIVPCYNEEESLPLLIERLSAAAATWPGTYEVVCVDDGSRDRTWELLQVQAKADRRWRCFSFSRNFGHQAAVSAGLKHCRGDAAIVIDADLQDPPEVLAQFIREWLAGFDVVFGVRESRRDTWHKRFFAWIFYRTLERLVTVHIPTDAGDFALMDRKVIDVMNQLPERSRYLRGLRAWSGFRQKPLVFRRDARAAGVPQYTFKKSLKLALDGIFSFSAAPLRFASYLGFAMSGFALFLTVFTFLQKVFHEFFERIGLGPGPGFATIVIAVTLLGGVQLICLGILGEYLGRIYDEVKGRPAWIISESTDSDEDRS